MKKLFLVLLAVALVGSFAFAEVTGVAAPTVSGSVTTTVGYDLDDEASGFLNESSVDVVVPLAGGSDTHSGSADVYAEITIEDIEISLSTDDEDVSYDASVSAKIVAGDIWVGLGSPDFSFNNVDQEDGDDVNLVDLAGDGVTIGYMSDAFSASLLVASVNDGYLGDKEDDGAELEDDSTSWTDSEESDAEDAVDKTGNADHEYAFGAQASVTAGPAVVDIQFGFLADMYMGFGATAVLTAGPATVTVPFDYVSNLATEENGMELQPAVAMAIDGVGSISANLFFATYDIASFVEQEITLGVGFVEGFSDALTMSVDAEVSGLAADADMAWGVDVATTFDMGAVAPYANFGIDSDTVVDLQVGAVFATAIDNATVTFDYTSDDVADFENNKGRVTLAVGVTY